jgi:repressor LexA
MSASIGTALTRRQQEILAVLQEEPPRFSHAPTLDELAHSLGMRSRGSLHKQIQALVEAGLVEPMNRQRRGIRLTTEAIRSLEAEQGLPLFGRVAAGRPIEAVPDTERILVPPALCTGPDCYVLQVKGDSMVEDGIFDGDWIIVEPRNVAANGEMVVALVDESEATVKRLLQRPGEVVLIPANSAMSPMTYTPDRVRIQGVVVGQMRRYS